MAAGVAANSTGAPPQAGVLEGVNPIEYTPSNPIALFIVQAIIVIVFCQLLHCELCASSPLAAPDAYRRTYCVAAVDPLRLLNQPRVIAEVIGGILLGPSVMMRIPGFKDGTLFSGLVSLTIPSEKLQCVLTHGAAIFPDASMAVFNNVANLGLVVFLFLVALEVRRTRSQSTFLFIYFFF